MIIELTKENFFLIDDSFINKLYLEHEFANNPYAKVLILKEKQNIIGYIYYSDIFERVEINQFEIDSFHRNCGKGDFLLKKLIEIVDKNISLEVKKDNYNAIQLYQKNGFIKKAIRKGYYQGIDAILMERNKDQ